MNLETRFAERFNLAGVTGSTVTLKHRVPDIHEEIHYENIYYVDVTSANTDITVGIRTPLTFVPLDSALNLAASTPFVRNAPVIVIEYPDCLEMQIVDSVNADDIRVGLSGKCVILEELIGE